MLQRTIKHSHSLSLLSLSLCLSLMASLRFSVGVFLLLLGLYCGIDPFKHSPMSGFPDFEAHKVEFPPWSEIPAVRDAENRLQRSEIRFFEEVQGPESIVFDSLGRGPYTGVADGRVLFWNGHSWTHFAYTSPNRSELCDPKPSMSSYVKNEHICGRPLGLRFHKRTGELYIADSYFGLMKVGPEGGLATSLVTEAEGVPLRFTNDLDIDDEGNVYFTDSSTKYPRRDFMQLVLSADNSGRLLKYNTMTRTTTVLLRNLQFPNGVSLSKDGSFFIFCEGSLGRLRRYWLKGEKSGTTDIFAILPGYPDNVRTNEKGEFWVALHTRRNFFTHICGLYPQLRKLLLRLPVPPKYQNLLGAGGALHALVVKYSPDGEIAEVLEDRQGKVVRVVSEAEEKDGKLWMGSVVMPFIAVY